MATLRHLLSASVRVSRKSRKLASPRGLTFTKIKKNIAQSLPKLSKQSQIKQEANVMQQNQPWHVPPLPPCNPNIMMDAILEYNNI